MKAKTKKALSEFMLYLIMVVFYGVLIALCNHWFRINGLPVKGLTALLIASTVYVYYRLWRRLCRRLNQTLKNEKDS